MLPWSSTSVAVLDLAASSFNRVRGSRVLSGACPATRENCCDEPRLSLNSAMQSAAWSLSVFAKTSARAKVASMCPLSHRPEKPGGLWHSSEDHEKGIYQPVWWAAVRDRERVISCGLCAQGASKASGTQCQPVWWARRALRAQIAQSSQDSDRVCGRQFKNSSALWHELYIDGTVFELLVQRL